MNGAHLTGSNTEPTAFSTYLDMPNSVILTNNLMSVNAIANTKNKKDNIVLTLNHNSYIYDKGGQRLKVHGRKLRALKKVKKLRIKSQINPINKIKRYYFYAPTSNDDTKFTPHWLPYKKIKGKYYYHIENNKYIKCINVSRINNYLVNASQATVIVKPLMSKTKAYAVDGKIGAYIKSKTFKTGTRLVVDDWNILGDAGYFSYHIKGTKYWIDTTDLKANPRPKYISNKFV